MINHLDQSTSPVIVALDYYDKAPALNLVKRIDPKFCRLKVGPVLFTRHGPAFLEELKTLGFDIFLDLKFHDIPQTVYHALTAAADLGMWMVNVHALGGKEMLLQAREAIDHATHKPILLAVTILTSLASADLTAIGMQSDVSAQVENLAVLTQQCGLDGVVCSAQEARLLRKTFNDDFILVTPGIRLENDEYGDQKRVMTPQQAFAAGANYIVVGRSVTRSADPLQVLEKIYTNL